MDDLRQTIREIVREEIGAGDVTADEIRGRSRGTIPRPVYLRVRQDADECRAERDAEREQRLEIERSFETQSLALNKALAELTDARLELRFAHKKIARLQNQTVVEPDVKPSKPSAVARVAAVLGRMVLEGYGSYMHIVERELLELPRALHSEALALGLREAGVDVDGEVTLSRWLTIIVDGNKGAK